MAELTKLNVLIINASMTLKDRVKEVQAARAALQIQVTDHFAPVWGRNADINLVCNDSSNKDLPNLSEGQKWLWLVLRDTSNNREIVGYHDVTDEGMPLGKVFVKTSEDSGRPWTVTASHELLEMLSDPSLNLSAFKEPDPDNVTGKDTVMFYAYDICDPCQEDQYKINGVCVSNFVYPTWFESFDHPKGTQFDYLHKMTEPFELRPGGFISVFDIPPKDTGGGWRQIENPSDRKTEALLGSRRERRIHRLSPARTKRSDVPPVPPFFG